MSNITIYHNPSCSKSRQTKAMLDEKDMDYSVVEYLKETPSATELTSILQKLGKNPLEVIRTKEALFSELGLSKTDNRPDDEWIRIMIDNPRLIERPIVVNNDKAAIGRPIEDVLEIL